MLTDIIIKNLNEIKSHYYSVSNPSITGANYSRIVTQPERNFVTAVRDLLQSHYSNPNQDYYIDVRFRDIVFGKKS